MGSDISLDLNPHFISIHYNFSQIYVNGVIKPTLPRVVVRMK